MLRVGVIGFGGMGHYHAPVYVEHPDTELVAVADIREQQLRGEAMQLNIGEGAALDMSGIDTFLSADDMLARAGLDIVDICLPTDLHAAYAVKALAAGAHVLCEKPMSRTLAQADAMIAAAKAADRRLMIAQCLRFWPCYERLQAAYETAEFGKLLMLSMRRVSGAPGWDADSWFRDGQRSGGALLDMHIHDTDFVHYLLGLPAAVCTTGASQLTGAIDNALTQYMYPAGIPVSAETSWSYGGVFAMSFCAIFEQATLEMGYVDSDLTLKRPGAEPERIELLSQAGHEREIHYFIECVQTGRAPERCLPASTRETMRIAFAEEESALAGGRVITL